MALRLGGLADVDPLAVPLPPGTEVTTRVDRVVGERTVQQGAIGRVVAHGGDEIEVEVVGVGRVRYLRAELVPRKLGLARYARRRHDAWHELAPTVVIDVVVGSRAWGLADASSDEDHRGVFVLPFDWQTGLADPPQDLASDDGTRSYWEIGKAVRQALRADPNTLEMLYAAGDDAATDPLGTPLLSVRDGFVSQEIYGAFGRYALTQLERLEHNQRLADHRALILDWLRADDTLSLDAVAQRLADAARVPGPTPADAHARARDYVKQLYRSLYDQGHLATAEWSALVDFARDRSHGFEPPRDLRPKNAYNLIRLLDLATRWLRGEPPILRVRDELRPTLLAIKRGEVPMTEVVAMAQTLTPQLEAARASSPLPRHADIARVEAALRAIRREVARRAFAREPGPWGADMPPPPVASFD